MTRDIRIADHGTVIQFVPLTAQGKTFLRGLDAEGWQYMGDTLVVDRRCAGDVILGARDEGLAL